MSSFITVTENSDHVLSNALKKKGFKKFVLIFAPNFSPDFGWTVTEGFLLPTWLGYSKKTALEKINELNSFYYELENRYKNICSILKNGGYIRCQGFTRDKIELFDKQHTRINIIDNKTFETLLKYKFIENKSIYKGSYNEYFTINEKTN